MLEARSKMTQPRSKCLSLVEAEQPILAGLADHPAEQAAPSRAAGAWVWSPAHLAFQVAPAAEVGSPSVAMAAVVAAAPALVASSVEVDLVGRRAVVQHAAPAWAEVDLEVRSTMVTCLAA